MEPTLNARFGSAAPQAEATEQTDLAIHSWLQHSSRGHAMAFDAALPIDTLVFAPAAERSHTEKTNCMSTPFRTHEGVSLAIGGLCLGALIGVFVFFATGRVAAWLPITVALFAFVYAIYLVGLSYRDVFAARQLGSFSLFTVHIAALLAWPILVLVFEPHSWPILLGLPLALAASSLFFLTAHAPARVMYRASAHVCLIAALGVYQWLWVAMIVPTA